MADNTFIRNGDFLTANFVIRSDQTATAKMVYGPPR